jgi:hypothetical protein
MPNYFEEEFRRHNGDKIYKLLSWFLASADNFSKKPFGGKAFLYSGASLSV